LGGYVALGWNNLGMHCMNRYYSNLCVLPPFNDILVQVIKRGATPQLVTSGAALTYRFPGNTYSTGKVDFWPNAHALFGVTLADNTGLTGLKMTGSLTFNGTAWEARGVPLTPFDDANLTTEQPYQFGEVTARDSATSATMDTTTFVVPVSTEIHCDNCHGNNAELDILQKHDDHNGTNLAATRPVLCASCHASNALGTTGQPGVSNLSHAVHGFHAGEVGPDTDCYNCHPGLVTKCLRGAMFKAGKTCTDCHGNLTAVGAAGRNPWVDEPRCETCHPTHPEEPGKLYRNSRGHGGLYCAACHNSTHAELPSVQPRDAVQVLRVQNEAIFIRNCAVCHTTPPTGPGPHGVMAPTKATPGFWVVN
jgi:hypothetical protein